MTVITSRIKPFGWQNWLKLVGMMIPILLAFWVFFSIEALYLPFLISFIIVYLSDPVIALLERNRIRRPYGIMIVFILAGLFLTWFFLYLFPFIQNEIKGLQDDVPKYVNKIQGMIAALQVKYPWARDIMEEVNIVSRLTEVVRRLALTLIGGSATVLQYLITLIILVPIITFFLLKDKREI